MRHHGDKCETTKETERTSCKFCFKHFSNYRNRHRHEKKCKPVPAKHTNPSSPTPASSCQPEKIPEKCLKCRKCDFKCSSASELYSHRALNHSQADSSSFQNQPWGDGEIAPWENEDGTIDTQFRLTYDQHRHLILKRKVTEYSAVSRFNFPITNDISMDDFGEQIEEIYNGNSNAFKINLSFGVILRHVETGQCRYFAPYSNDNVFELPLLISCRSDIDKFMHRLSEIDILNYMLRQRPNTSWKPIMVCNVVYTLFRTSFALGHSKTLPNYVKKRKSIISLDCDPSTGKPYDDDLCMFRCLAYHEVKNVRRIEKLTKAYYTRWLLFADEHKIRNSEISTANIPHVEQCFQTNINIFSLNKDKTCDGVYKSMGKFQDKTVYLNLYENHLSYIANFATYASKYRCSLCDRMFPSAHRLNRHAKTCENKTKLRFPGGYYNHLKTIFDKLEEWNIFVAPEKRFYPWFAVFDLEAVLVPEEPRADSKKKLINCHKAICVCICSNVPGFEKEHFILNEDKSDLIEAMCEYLTRISIECQNLAKNRWKDVFQAITKLENKWCSEIGNDETCDSDSPPNDDVIMESNAEINICEARESGDYEPPSAEFLEKMSQENVWYRFMRDLTVDNTSHVSYNNWGETSDNSSLSETSSDDRSSISDSEDEINYSKTLQSNSRKRHWFDSDDDETDYNLSQQNKKMRCHSNHIDDDHDDDDDDDTENDFESINTNPHIAELMKKKVLKMKQVFESYCEQLPVLGFNSGKYDVNLIKSELALHLGLHNSTAHKFIIKKNNNYTCLANSALKFLDMCNYLPPGTSYDSFLVSFNVPVRKSFFPYEYLTNASKLDETRLPPPECFYSSLKNCNTLENKTFLRYSRLIENENKSSDEALKILKLETTPSSSIGENYAKLQTIWKEKKMNTLRDFLQYYAELDVGPMVQGVKNYQEFFFERRLDVFKDYISVPGLARKMLYDCGLKSGASFSLFDKYDADLYETFMSNMTGGPSIIFTRRHKVGETLIRGQKDRSCQSIFGYDANSLYLYAICQEMPTGRYIRRKSADAFRPENHVKRYYAMYDWMNWLSYKTGKRIKHKMNQGQEFRIGPYYVDGKSDQNEIYEFMGCFFHGHTCQISKDDQRETKYENTMKRLEFLKQQGFKVITIWECEYRQQLRENEEMRAFVRNGLPQFYRKHPYSVTHEKIMDGVRNNDLFGFVEVDIEVPDSWQDVNYKPNTHLSPYEYFSEMCPLFLTTEIPFSCIGKHMQDHAKTFNLSEKPRKLLVGGLRAKQMLIMTPLLNWYVSHGMRVTKIHQVIEYSRQACFEEFGKRVSDARRDGDADLTKQVIALLFKLIGNSSFGGTIMNKEKQRRHKYVKGFKKASLEVNNPRFSNMIEFENDIFEMEFKKGRIVIDTPIVLGIAILNYAKLHLLRFYYDFLDVFVGRDRFECIECDTDSLYFALSETSLFDAIKIDKKQEFKNNLMNNCSDTITVEPGVGDFWFPRECCKQHHKFDLKTPGLMKKEFEATRMTGLCSKSYVAKCETTGAVKYSLKGINKCFEDPTNNFERVLASQTPASGENRGIALHNNTMYSYNQIKRAFSYFYCKREVCKDGIHTKPLDICLQPIKRK